MMRRRMELLRPSGYIMGNGWLSRRVLQMISIRSFSTVSASLALASCATTPSQSYPEPGLPDALTALISVPRHSSDRTAATVRILSVDTPQGEIVRVSTNSLRIVPRSTCIEAFARTSTLDTFSASLCFETYAGQRYEVRALTEGTRLPPQLRASGENVQMTANTQSGPYNVTRLFVIDAATREIVAVAEP